MLIVLFYILYVYLGLLWHRGTSVIHSKKVNIYVNLYFLFIVLLSRQNAALSFTSKHTMPPDRRKMGNGVSLHQVLSTYPDVRGIYLEIEIYTIINKILRIKNQNILT